MCVCTRSMYDRGQNATIVGCQQEMQWRKNGRRDSGANKDGNQFVVGRLIRGFANYTYGYCIGGLMTVLSDLQAVNRQRDVVR
jgi:hypothetical protein